MVQIQERSDPRPGWNVEPRRQTARKDSCTTSSAAPRSLRMRRATVWARPPYRSYKASIPSGEWAEIERTMSSSLRCTLMLRHTLGGCASVGTHATGRSDHGGTRRYDARPPGALLTRL